MIVRPETPADTPLIRSLTEAAFADVARSHQTEARIVDALRAAGALALSLVAEQDGVIVGHVAFSPVLMDGADPGWFGLGPISVAPRLQRGGIGTALIEQGLRLLVGRGARGCVVLGDPGYYGRFGFSRDHALRYGGVSTPHFQSMVLAGDAATGEVTYHQAFETV